MHTWDGICWFNISSWWEVNRERQYTDINLPNNRDIAKKKQAKGKSKEPVLGIFRHEHGNNEVDVNKGKSHDTSSDSGKNNSTFSTSWTSIDEEINWWNWGGWFYKQEWWYRYILFGDPSSFIKS